MDNMRSILLAALAISSVAFALPAVASAGTSDPGLATGDDQAYLADSNGDPQNGSATTSGALTLTGAATISCSSVSNDSDYSDDGSGVVNSYSTSGCAVAGFPSCPVTVAPTNLGWFKRFVRAATSIFRVRINISISITFGAGTPTCPVPAGTYPLAGILSPAVSISGTTLTESFGTGSGSLSGPLGTATVDGTLTGAVPSGSQFVA